MPNFYWCRFQLISAVDSHTNHPTQNSPFHKFTWIHKCENSRMDQRGRTGGGTFHTHTHSLHSPGIWHKCAWSIPGYCAPRVEVNLKNQSAPPHNIEAVPRFTCTCGCTIIHIHTKSEGRFSSWGFYPALFAFTYLHECPQLTLRSCVHLS